MADVKNNLVDNLDLVNTFVDEYKVYVVPNNVTVKDLTFKPNSFIVKLININKTTSEIVGDLYLTNNDGKIYKLLLRE